MTERREQIHVSLYKSLLFLVGLNCLYFKRKCYMLFACKTFVCSFSGSLKALQPIYRPMAGAPFRHPGYQKLDTLSNLHCRYFVVYVCSLGVFSLQEYFGSQDYGSEFEYESEVEHQR